MSFSTNQPFTASWQDKVIGLAVLAGLALGIYWYASKNSILDTQRWLHAQAYLSQTYGISKDVPIRLAGVTVGKVLNVDLTDDGKVKFGVLLDKEYRHFFRADSRLKIDSQIGINTVISGTNLLLETGSSLVSLAENATIPVTEPKSFEQLIDDYNVVGFADKVSIILDNLDTITSTISDNQQELRSMVGNLAIATESLATSSQQLPELLQASSRLLDNLNTTMTKIDPKLNASFDGLAQNLELSQQLMLDMQVLIGTVDEVTNMTPETLAAANTTLREVGNLTKQLSGHWLLGGEQQKTAQTSSEISVSYPPDWSLYQTEQTDEQN